MPSLSFIPIVIELEPNIVRDISYFDILTSLESEHRSFGVQILHCKALLTEVLHPQPPECVDFIFSCSTEEL